MSTPCDGAGIDSDSERLQMTPTKITLEKTATHVQLKVSLPGTLKGYAVIESVPFQNGVSPKGRTVDAMRKHATKYANHFAIPFADETQGMTA